MQQLAHLYIDGNLTLVLVRPIKWGVAMKLRKSGELGTHRSDEEAALHQPMHAHQKTDLLDGKVVKL